MPRPSAEAPGSELGGHYERNLVLDTIASRHAFEVGVLTVVRKTPDSG